MEIREKCNTSLLEAEAGNVFQGHPILDAIVEHTCNYCGAYLSVYDSLHVSLGLGISDGIGMSWVVKMYADPSCIFPTIPHSPLSAIMH